MNFSKLIYRSIKHYKKQHIALLLGTIISTAVLTGALIIGDSVQYSLRSLVDKRLGNAEYVLQSGDRFITTDLSQKIAADLDSESASILHLNGIAINTDTETRINKIQVLGIKQSFWTLSELQIPELNEDEAFISENVAEKLNLKINDEFLLRVANAEIIPLNAPFAEEKDATVAFRLKIKRILTDDELGRYSLKSDQKAPYNVFLSQEILAEKLELEGLVNTILIAGTAEIDAIKLDQSLKENWTLTDAGLQSRNLENEGRIEILSDRIFIDEPIAHVLESLNPAEKILSYLVNSIQHDSLEAPYSFVSAISTSKSTHNEISVNKWLADDLQIETGDSLPISYFTIGPLRNLIEKQDTFVVRAINDIGSAYFQKSMMPEFPGLADAGSCSDWNTGIPIDLDKIRDIDEDYWDEHKGTPKAIISLEKGQELWGNKYGQYTSFRFDLNTIQISTLEQSILDKLDPEELNLSFNNARTEGKQAANNSVDFGELFLSLSFFVILAGVLLTILLYALNTVSRSQETAILSAIGYSKKKILRIRLFESSIVIVAGSLAGVGVGILYNQLLLSGLNSVWQDAVRTNMLDVFIKSSTLFIGAFSGMIISFISIYFVTRRQLKHQLTGLLKKDDFVSKKKRYSLNVYYFILILSFAGSALLIGYSIFSGIDQNTSLFLAAGFLFLLGCFAWIGHYLSKTKGNNQTLNLKQLVFKNLSLNRKRNLAAIILLALGTFSVIITGANRKTFYGVENDNSSGTGGYLFWAETSMPVLNDLSSREGIERFGLDTALMKEVELLQMHVLNGNDASCLNLNLVQNPQVLGIDFKALVNRRSFSFTKTIEHEIADFSKWQLLSLDFAANIYPAIVDQTVLSWGLMKEVGDTLFYKDEFGEQIGFILVAGLENSIFQGNILVSNEVFNKHFTSVSGSKVMLVDAPENNLKEVHNMLSEQFIDLGIEITPTSQRLAEFNSVTNSYLTVFMMLGGLGILIGTFGLGIVLLRNLMDRKYELALLKAIGYRKKQIFNLIFLENILILGLGLASGIVAAFIGILPSLLSTSFTVPFGFVGTLIGTILLIGLVSIYFSTRKALKGNYLEHLRSE